MKKQIPQYVLKTGGAICESVVVDVVVCASARAGCGPLWALRASPGARDHFGCSSLSASTGPGYSDLLSWHRPQRRRNP